MIARLLVAPLFLAAAALAADPQFTVSTDSINQCKPAKFQIAGNWGANPHLSVLPSVDPCAHDALVEIPITITNGEFTWDSATIAAGTSVVVLIDDDAGHEAWSNTIVVGGSAADCPATTSSPSGSGSGSGSRAASTSSSASTRRPTTGSGDTPGNAASNTNSPSSASASVRGSIGTVVVALLSAVAFLA